MQRSLLAEIVDGALECTWLIALVSVPALMNVHSERIFEGDKVPFLRALALLAVALWVVRRIEQGEGGLLRKPLVLAAAGILAVNVLANVFSIAPEISFWGSYDRLQGTATLLAYAAFFFVFITGARPSQVERMVTAALIAALVPSVYALVQILGIDPITWGPEVIGRVQSTAGNAIFLGAILIMVMPLSLARLVGAMENERTAAAAVYLTLLVLQAIALALTQSRGPILALAVGLAVFVVTAALSTGIARAARAVAAIAVVAGIVVGSLMALAVPVREDAAVAMNPRLANARVRLLIWQGTTSLIAAQPSRLLLGYGPDTFRLAFQPFFSAELTKLEEADVTADRAHNDVLDTIVNAGVVGLVARICFVGALIVLLFRVAVTTQTSGNGDLLAIGLLAAVAAHLAELQVAIPTAATELYFWMCAAAAVAVHGSTSAAELPSGATSHELRAATYTDSDDSRAEAVLGIASAQLLAVAIFGLYTPVKSNVTLAAVLGLVWLLSFAVVNAGAVVSSRRTAIRFALASLGGALAFALAYARWVHWRPERPGVLIADDYITHFVSVLYVSTFMLIVLGGLLAAFSSDRRSRRFSNRPWIQVVVVPLLLVVTAWLVSTTSLSVERADIYAKQGLDHEIRQEFGAAAQAYEQALQLQPWESRYALLRARALSDAAAAGGDALGAGVVERAALAAWELNPLETDNAAIVARVNRRLFTANADHGHRDEADLFYQRALRLSPQRPLLWNEYAGFLLEIGAPARALAAIDEGLRLDATSSAGKQLLAHACARLPTAADPLAQKLCVQTR